MLCGKSYCTSEPAINETDRLEALGHSNPSFSSSSFSSPSSPCRKNLTLKTAQGPPSSTKPTEVSRISGVFRKAKRPDFNGRWVCISTYGLDEARSKLGKMVETSGRWDPTVRSESQTTGGPFWLSENGPAFRKRHMLCLCTVFFLAGVRHCDVFFGGSWNVT